jgi:CheY-like chemotaxis protein
VDDRDDDITLAMWAFRKAELAHTITQVLGGKEAIAYLEGAGAYSDRAKYPLPQMVLLDLKMPEVNGFDVLTWIRKHNHTRALPVIILSGSAWRQDIEHAYELGANSYLLKPSELDNFVTMVRTLHKYWFQNSRLPSLTAASA